MAVDNGSDSVFQVASEIIRYLEKYPEASDGIAGIRDFWLGGIPLPKDSYVLDAALDQLVNAGVLKRVKLPGGESIYRFTTTT